MNLYGELSSFLIKTLPLRTHTNLYPLSFAARRAAAWRALLTGERCSTMYTGCLSPPMPNNDVLSLSLGFLLLNCIEAARKVSRILGLLNFTTMDFGRRLLVSCFAMRVTWCMSCSATLQSILYQYSLQLTPGSRF